MSIRRAGLLIPSSNTTVEYEYNRFGPPDLSWHAGRLTFTTIARETLAAQDAELLREAKKLATARPDLILVCQSAAGFVLGQQAERALVQRLQAATGIQVLSLAALMAAALHALGVSRIALATPFPSGVDTDAAAYFTQSGFDVVRTASLGLSGNATLAEVPPDRLIALAQDADAPTVEAVVIPGGNLRTLAVLDRMESALGKPLLSTNQVGLWAAAAALGCQAHFPGRLAQAGNGDTVRRALIATS